MGFGGTLIVAGVWVLIGFIGLTSQYFVFWDYLGGLTAHTLTVLGGFNILLALLCYNYYLACRVDPGRVPCDWEPPANPEEVLVIEVKKNNAGPRYCRVCKHFKPPRTHHCSSCQRCVLKMDHHCPWLNNCIGYYNYGYFIRFLIYVDLTCAYCLVLLCRRVWQLYVNRRNWSVYYAIQPSQTEFGFLLVNLILDTIVLFLVGVLSIYHLWLLIDNTTTIETFEKDRIKKLVRRRIVSQLNYPYDVGFVGNIKQVLGPAPWLWLWPQAMPKGGVMFPIAPHLQPPVYWPPMESTTFETPTIYDTRPTHTSKVRLARPKAESYELAAISASDRERMISQFTSDASSGVDTDAFSIDTYDSDDDYFAEEEDDLVALNRAVDRIAEHSNQMQKRKLPRSDSATSVSPGGSQTMPSSSTFTRKPPGSSTPSAVSAQSFSATPSQDETATFTKGSLLHQLHQKQKSS